MLRIHSSEDLIVEHKTNSEIDEKISSILIEVGLGRNNNVFFTTVRACSKVNATQGFNIAYNWREITKTFLFTTIKGLSCLVENIEGNVNSSLQLLSILQTTFSVISDDLSNNHPILKDSAPPGPKGIHYKWWEETILNPLQQYVRNHPKLFTPGTRLLTEKMRQLSTNYLGIAVQLRVVEAIALDICEAFLILFSNVVHKNKKIFPDQKQLAWITSHIQAEKVHHEQVCNQFSGMASIVTSLDESSKFLNLIHDYANAWNVALGDFADFIKNT